MRKEYKKKNEIKEIRECEKGKKRDSESKIKQMT